MWSPRYVMVDGEVRSRLWWYRLWKWAHNRRCAECRQAYQ